MLPWWFLRSVQSQVAVEVGKTREPLLHELLNGDAIREELKDTNIADNLDETVTKCTKKAKAEIKKMVTERLPVFCFTRVFCHRKSGMIQESRQDTSCICIKSLFFPYERWVAQASQVIFVLSLTGHGGSSLIGHLLDQFPGTFEKPAVGFQGPVTQTEKGFPATVEGFSSKGAGCGTAVIWCDCHHVGMSQNWVLDISLLEMMINRLFVWLVSFFSMLFQNSLQLPKASKKPPQILHLQRNMMNFRFLFFEAILTVSPLFRGSKVPAGCGCCQVSCRSCFSSTRPAGLWVGLRSTWRSSWTPCARRRGTWGRTRPWGNGWCCWCIEPRMWWNLEVGGFNPCLL